MRITVKTVGDKELQRLIKKLEDKGHLELKKAVTQSAIYVEGVAKNTTAWKNITGRLRADITHEVKSDGTKHQGRIGTNVFYGKILEFGSAKRNARPWLFPALKESRGKILGFIKAAFKRLK